MLDNDNTDETIEDSDSGFFDDGGMDGGGFNDGGFE